jgi:hypothetical protein
VRWIAKDLETQAQTAPAGRYVVVGDGGAFPAAIASEFERFGDACQLMAPPDEDAGDTGSIVAEAAAGARAIIIVADAFGIESGAAADLVSGQRICGLLSSLSRALETKPGPAARIFVVTAGTQPAGVQAPLAIAASPAWGLGRVLALEHPAVWGGLIDVSAAADVQDAVRVVHQIRQPDAEDQSVVRAGVRHVPRLDNLAIPAAAPVRVQDSRGRR